MIKQGLIVSIQKYSYGTIQELAEMAIKAGAVAIRSDRPIEINVPLIGLIKLKGKKYYITTSMRAIENVSFCTNFIAIDSRKGNKDLLDLYNFCKLHSIDIIADIGTIEDVKNILSNRLIPSYFCTTFSFMYNNNKPNISLISKIKKLTNIPIIAEGGYDSKNQVIDAFYAGANNVCIGYAISKIYEKTKYYVKIINERC